MFLGITASVDGWDAEGSSCNLKFADNPLTGVVLLPSLRFASECAADVRLDVATDFVELPSSLAGLHFANVICGAIRGALEMVQMRVECRFVTDMLAGDAINTIRSVCATRGAASCASTSRPRCMHVCRILRVELS